MWCWSGGKGILRKLSVCYSIVYYYNDAWRYEQLTVSGFDLAWFSSLSSKHLCVFSLHGATYIVNFFWLHSSLYFLVSWAWWDWPLIWLTNHCPSVLWHCWLDHTTCKIVSKMTYNVWSWTLSPTALYHTMCSDSIRSRASGISQSDRDACQRCSQASAGVEQEDKLQRPSS